MFWNEDHFKVHLQDERGLFSPAAESFTTDVAFDSDEFSSLAAGDMLGKVLHSLTDLNGDSVADIVVFSLEGKNMSRKRSAYEVHFGTPTPDGGTVFAPEVNAVFRSDDSIQLGMRRHDFDCDGRVDLMLTTIDLDFLKGSIWKRLKGFMGDDIWLDLEFYHMEAGLYPDKPNTTRRIALDGAPSHREPGWVPLDIVLRGGTHESRNTQKSYLRAFNRTLLIGDVTGDGRSDLLIEWTHMQLCVYVGVPGTRAIRPTASKSGSSPAQRRGIHLAGGHQQRRGAGHPHASPVHAARCSRSPETESGNRAASGDDADRPISEIGGVTV